MWRNGIKWIYKRDMDARVDLLSNQSVSVAICCSEHQRLDLVEQRTATIALIRSLKDRVCPQLEVSESIMHRGAMRVTDFANVATIKKAILAGKKNINTQDRNSVPIRDFLMFDSLEGATTKAIQQLYNKECANNTVSEDFLESLAQTFVSSFDIRDVARALNVPTKTADAIIDSQRESQKEKVLQLLREWKHLSLGTYSSLKETLLRFSIMPAELN